MYIVRRNILIAGISFTKKEVEGRKRKRISGKEMKRYIADKQQTLRPELFQFKCN